jgi:hypothetical protein
MAQPIEDSRDLVVGEAPRQIPHDVECGRGGAPPMLSALLPGYFEFGVLTSW